MSSKAPESTAVHIEPDTAVSQPNVLDNLKAAQTLEQDGMDRHSTNDSLTWQKALDVAVSSCVVLRVTSNRSFDTGNATVSCATGFVVDEKLGIILTNRHVVTPGPITCEALFLNREELAVKPLYYDPVHDFGFLSFDPRKLQFMKSGSIPLAPEAARVGLEVRVVGNDSGEKLSILSGTLARLDRDAPVYSRKGFNDFNTFYLQAASGTKGGSSGSPVIDVQGRAVGLNAGGKNKASSAYYLPLHRIVRALAIVQKHFKDGNGSTWSARKIPRGDLQTTFCFKGFEEVRRLGLKHDTESLVRGAADSSSSNTERAERDAFHRTGMLVVDSVLPGGPADGKLQPGDALVRLNGTFMTAFLPMEELLDSAVGQSVNLEVDRAGRTVEVSVTVQDLYDITPCEYLEMASGIFHALSYQQARNMTMPVGSVYVAQTGFMLDCAHVPKYALIVSVNFKPTPDMVTFRSVIAAAEADSRVTLQFITSETRHTPHTVVVHLDWRWHGVPLLWKRNDSEGWWESTEDIAPSESDYTSLTTDAAKEQHKELPATSACTAAAKVAATTAPTAATEAAIAEAVSETHATKAATTALASLRPDGSPGQLTDMQLEIRLRGSLVDVTVDIPYVAMPDGVHSSAFKGTGVVVHLGDTFGLVLTDHNTVTVASGEVTLSFAAFPCEISGSVSFLHPLHNWALVSFPISSLSAEAARVVMAAKLDDRMLQPGEKVWLAGLASGHTIVRRRSTVITATESLSIANPIVPRFRAVHEEVIKLDHSFGTSISGVLTDDNANVLALWASYSEQRRNQELEFAAGCASRSFLPWVRTVATSLQGLPQLVQPPSAPPVDATEARTVVGPRPIGANRELPVTVLDSELMGVGLAKAAQQGLPAEWVTRLTLLDPQRRQVLQVSNCLVGSSASKVLKAGDLLLAVEGQPVASYPALDALLNVGRLTLAVKRNHSEAACSSSHEVDSGATNGEPPLKRQCAATKDDLPSQLCPQPDAAHKQQQQQQPQDETAVASQTADSIAGSDLAGSSVGSMKPSTGAKGNGDTLLAAVTVTICRQGVLHDVQFDLETESSLGTTHLLHFAGAQFQANHRAIREGGYLPPGGSVFISRWHHGSPAHRYGLYGLHWLTEMAGQRITDMETLVKVTSAQKDGSFVRCVLVELHTTKVKVISVKTDLRYWPCWQLRLVGTEWRRETLASII